MDARLFSGSLFSSRSSGFCGSGFSCGSSFGFSFCGGDFGFLLSYGFSLSCVFSLFVGKTLFCGGFLSVGYSAANCFDSSLFFLFPGLETTLSFSFVESAFFHTALKMFHEKHAFL